MARLKDKVAIVTGAARGQGAATARLFIAQGAKVVLTDVLKDVSDLARDLGPSARSHIHDVTDERVWAEVVKATLKDFQRVDVLVNNAGIVHIAEFTATKKADLDRVLAINTGGTFLGMQAVLPHMLERKSGSIINISSVGGITGMAGMSVYAASKWAITGLTKTVALEVASRGVRINSIHPGAIDTFMVNPHNDLDTVAAARHHRIPMQRLGRPDEIAQASLFLASDDAAYITGTGLTIDGAWTSGLSSEGAVDPNAG